MHATLNSSVFSVRCYTQHTRENSHAAVEVTVNDDELFFPFPRIDFQDLAKVSKILFRNDVQWSTEMKEI